MQMPTSTEMEPCQEETSVCCSPDGDSAPEQHRSINNIHSPDAFGLAEGVVLQYKVHASGDCNDPLSHFHRYDFTAGKDPVAIFIVIW